MRIMSHVVEGQDSNLINNSSNIEEIEYNCNQSINQSSKQLVFFAESCQANSHRMQFEKIGRGLLREAFRGERECLVSRKRGGK